MSPLILHLIYIHGFNGDETTFQAFPSHLQQYLSDRIPLGLNVQVQSTIYPTYKSVKPIANARKNFLEWLNTQPSGPVILLGHSMGGLLAAEAATDVSNNPPYFVTPRRIVGMISFDTPYLGMHPHVVISGIASLFAKEEKTPTQKTESELNRHSSVKIANDRVTDDWENYKKTIQANNSRTSLNSYDSSSHLSVHSPASSSPHLSPTNSSIPSVRPPSPTSRFIDRTLNLVSDTADDPFVRWLRKHSDEPFTASKRWVVEHFQFGICMFDPSGLKTRYTRLVSWNGLWVNYWTITPPRKGSSSQGRDPQDHGVDAKQRSQLAAENDVGLIEAGISDGGGLRPISPSTHRKSASFSSATSLLSYTSTSPSSLTSDMSDLQISTTPKVESGTTLDPKAAEKERKRRKKEVEKLKKEREKEAKALAKTEKAKVGRHFIVLPNGLGSYLGGRDKWEQIVVGGVDDEVAAHTGLFIPSQNLDYEGLIERVSSKILGWLSDGRLGSAASTETRE
ncbi:hypothetical protein D9758_005348 [Tetrapyrgos nigripes]|uniref:Thioesterase domain-containing protein n=1 Tax=Tetrapyrgos nigripes TaxID=182062 RepID=A0A8H5GI25_9AGAR|nr:hypothetical protein D9758_005348 [Tetrapyrgos nigripes]